jgi:large subunit ribosomal protein L17
MNTGAGRKLQRPTGHRFALLRNMTASLIHYEKVETTHAKAKEVQRFADKIITRAKTNDMNSRRMVARDLKSKIVITKLFDVVAPRYKDRQGGYTQFIRKGQRFSDGAEMGVLKLVS